MDESSIRQLKVVELREELQKLNLPTTGKKDELIARLLEAQPVITKPKTPVTSPKLASIPKRITPPPVEDKLVSRAERFNLPPNEEELKKRRKMRFGGIEDEFFDAEKLRARQARFGVITSSVLAREELEAQKAKRTERFSLNTK
jgi:hypothetical protein